MFCEMTISAFGTITSLTLCIIVQTASYGHPIFERKLFYACFKHSYWLNNLKEPIKMLKKRISYIHGGY